MTLSPSPSFAPASCVTQQPVHLNPTDDVVLRVSGDDVTCCVYSFRLPRASRRSGQAVAGASIGVRGSGVSQLERVEL